MKRIYLSGPMTNMLDLNISNVPHRDGRPAQRRAHHHQPRRTHPDPGTWSEGMRRDIKALMDSDTVATLPGWQDSQGASLEVHIGKELGMRVVNAHNMVSKEVAG